MPPFFFSCPSALLDLHSFPTRPLFRSFALEAQRVEGKSAREAILQACSIRFRPIMMTTMAALMGTLPIALGVGVGSESRRPPGAAGAGRLACSQIVVTCV